MSITVTSHVGRDLLQNGAYFNSAPKVVLEYASNSIDYAPDGQVVTVDITISPTEIIIADNGSGMAQEDLMHFFTMHGVNRQRKRGRKVRGRFGTGKSAAFGIADGLCVETIKDGKRNVLQLHRERILNYTDGGAIPVEHVVVDEPTQKPSGTSITIYDLQLDKIFITPVKERLEHALGRHLDVHQVSINGRRLRYRRPEPVADFAFDPPAEILARMPNTSQMHIFVAREALTPIENGVAVLANGFLNAMTLGSASGKAYTDRIFGEVEAPDLDNERDDEHFPAFDNTRDLSLNAQNPRAALILNWLSQCVEEVRQELDIEAQLARLSEINSSMQDAADFASSLINSDFARVQRRLKVVAADAVEANVVGASDLVEIEVERPISIDYSIPDAPEALPLPIEVPVAPKLEKEAVKPVEAYEAYLDFATELDTLEEQAYFEAVIQEAQAWVSPEERREVVREALVEVPKSNGNGNGNAYHTEFHQQHVVSDHQVLVTHSAENLQNNNHHQEHHEEWVVDRASFVAGGQAPKYKKPQRRTYFHVQFEHMGEEAPRARFSEDTRTIFINRDHPQIEHVEAKEGVESLAYKNLMNEIVIHEYASAIVRQMASTGFYVADPFDAIETIQAVVNRLALEAGQRLQENVAAEEE